MLLLLAAHALADDAPADAPPAPPPDLSGATALGGLTKDQVAELEPARHKLAQNPYQLIDFTAYTLEWGEVKLGLGSVEVGVVPRVQVGTAPVLDALGVYNGSLKANVLRVGPVDQGLEARHYWMAQDGFAARYTALGGVTSLRLADPWSLHAGASYSLIHAVGLPDPSRTAGLLVGDPGAFSGWYAIMQELGYQVDLDAQAVNLRVATDVRFNRRDSLILQGRAMIWRDLRTDTNLPPILNLDSALDVDESGPTPITETYAASLAYQASFKNADLRLGIGWSADRVSWLVQAFELDWRFGGKTRVEERKMRTTWRRNRRDNRKDR